MLYSFIDYLYVCSTEIAWDIITDFSTELLEGPDKERVSHTNHKLRFQERFIASGHVARIGLIMDHIFWHGPERRLINETEIAHNEEALVSRTENMIA